MTFVAAKCTQCGANLEIESTKDAAICPNCNTPFVVEKAVHYHNTYNNNNYKIEHSEVHFYDEQSKEVRLKNAEIFWLKHKDKEKARHIYEEVADNAPDDYRGWWGLARVESQEFAFVGCGDALFREIEEWVHRAFTVASKEVQEELAPVWNAYKEEVVLYKDKKKNQRLELVAQQKNAAEKKQSIENMIAQYQTNIEELDKECKHKQDQCERPSRWCYLASGIAVLIYGIGLLVLVPLLVRLLILKKSLSDLMEERDQRTQDMESLTGQLEQMDRVIGNLVNNIQVIDRIMS